PFVFQFQTLSKEFAEFPDRFFAPLDAFLEQLPKDFQYAIEIRNREFLSPAYFEILNRHGATHCFNHWTRMPPLIDQMKAAARAGGLKASFYVARILTPIGLSYEEAVERYSPYNQIRSPLLQMREDVVRLAKRALDKQITAFIIVNNRAEGYAPMTINDIGSMIVSGSR
ncbi:MAG: DUF72 domain-containing protein, partial [Bdellovibrionales bacterium]|nr:DUF72 domain-containing protein [Bdellovibrionales bacterium]